MIFEAMFLMGFGFVALSFTLYILNSEEIEYEGNSN
jgi:hypothetical protein